jgi:predicted permease
MSIVSRLHGLFSRRLDADLDAELRSHIEMRIEANIAAGMSPEEARRDALLRFGNRTLVKERTRRADIIPWLETFAHDVRYALRVYRKSPLFTVVAVITLTLGIGANTAMFTLTHAVLLRALPVQHPEELVRITFAKPDQDFGLSGPMFDEIKKRQQVYSDVLGWSGSLVKVGKPGDIHETYAALATGNAFSMLGVEPAAGRLLTPADDRPGGGSDGWTTVLAYEYWVSHFNASTSAIGQTITVEGTPVMIVGVLPRNFEGVLVAAKPAFVLPLEMEPLLHREFPMRHAEGGLFLTVIGRLKAGKTLADAREEVRRIGPSIQHDTDAKGILSKGFFAGSTWGVESARTGRMYERSRYREPLLFLQALVGIILLICAANIAGLMLARSSARRHEFAVRAALGASRMRIMRQLAFETGLLALVGGATSLAVASPASRAVVVALIGTRSALNLSPDRAVFGFTAGIALFVTVAAALPAALRSTRVQPVSDLKSGAAVGGRTRTESVFVAAQVGLSLVLLVSAGLLAGSLRHLLTLDPGFSTSGIVLIPTDFSSLNHQARRPEMPGLATTSTGANGPGTDSKAQLAYRTVLERLKPLPNIQSVSAEAVPLLTGWISSTSVRTTGEHGAQRVDDQLSFNTVGPDYFATAGTAVLQGRDVRFSDDHSGEKVCWLNRSSAKYLFPAGDALGKALVEVETGKPQCVVAGVVQDTKYTSLKAPAPRMIYEPYLQFGDEPFRRQDLFLMIRTDNVQAAVESARRVLREVAPTTPLLDPVTVSQQLHKSIGQEQTTAMLAIFFGALALLLAGIGLYGLLSYQVLQRTREIGVRIALGASRGNVVTLIARDIGLLLGIGVAIGLVASLGVSRVIGGLLFDMRRFDPWTYVAAVCLLGVAAVVATCVPTRRATRVDPMIALRYE